jgi:hypothetical protein
MIEEVIEMAEPKVKSTEERQTALTKEGFILLLIGEGCFIAVVPICNKEGFLSHPLSDRTQERGILDRPQRVLNLILVYKIEQRGSS